jgi:hypothetical protein
MVPVDSSAARIPFPVVAIAFCEIHNAQQAIVQIVLGAQIPGRFYANNIKLQPRLASRPISRDSHEIQPEATGTARGGAMVRGVACSEGTNRGGHELLGEVWGSR